MTDISGFLGNISDFLVDQGLNSSISMTDTLITLKYSTKEYDYTVTSVIDTDLYSVGSLSSSNNYTYLVFNSGDEFMDFVDDTFPTLDDENYGGLLDEAYHNYSSIVPGDDEDPDRYEDYLEHLETEEMNDAFPDAVEGLAEVLKEVKAFKAIEESFLAEEE